MNYKCYLKNKYIVRSEDISGEKFEVRKIVFINFGYGEILDEEGNLRFIKYSEIVFIRFIMDIVEKLIIVFFVKKR